VKGILDEYLEQTLTNNSAKLSQEFMDTFKASGRSGTVLVGVDELDDSALLCFEPAGTVSIRPQNKPFNEISAVRFWR
jgi:hypothetical protein